MTTFFLSSTISDMWSAIQLDSALTDMVEGASSQVASLLPIGIGLMFALAIPRIVKRVINTFL